MQVFRQSPRAGIAALRVLLQALQADDLEVARYPAVQLRRRLGSGAANLVEGLGQAAAHERGVAGQQSVEDRAQAIDIRRRGERSFIAANLLGRHVGRGSNGIAGVCQAALGLDPAGQAKVGDVRLAALSSRMFAGFRSRWRMPRWCA